MIQAAILRLRYEGIDRGLSPSIYGWRRTNMNKPTLRIEQQQPRNIQRADIAPEHGYAMVVDGHYKVTSRKIVPRRRQRQNCWRDTPCCGSKFTML